MGPSGEGARWTCCTKRSAPGHGNEVAFGQTCKDVGRFVLPAAGTGTVEVYTDGTATGPYTFTVRPSQ